MKGCPEESGMSQGPNTQGRVVGTCEAIFFTINIEANSGPIKLK